ncbi:MAG: TldD/PmbA family protein [Actinomycetota bacterium]|nr:TldD/PmbA family protein [Actinomycetota bacterium]
MSRTGAGFSDVYVELSRSKAIVMEDGKIEKILGGTDSGAGLRAISGGKTSYAYTNVLRKDAFLDAAGRLATAAGEREEKTLDLTKKTPLTDFRVRVLPDDVPLDRKLLLLTMADKAARGVSSHVKQVSILYRDLIQKVQIASSDGLLAEDERLQSVFTITVIAEKDGVVQTGYESAGGFAGFELFDSVSTEELAVKAAQKAVMMLSARRAPAGRMPVVISSEAGGTMIHEAVGHSLEADLALEGLSVYTGKVGQKIAADIVTVLDDSTIPGKRGSFRFDDEGTFSRRNVLVKDGVLASYMYDRLSAIKAGTESTGNGRRQSYRFRPIPRMTNTLIAPGKTPAAEVLKSTGKGLFVKKMGGGQVNTLTGDFVFDVQEGYLIENGEAGEPVRGATLAGNGPQVLMQIDIVGSDLGFSIGTCGKDAQGVPVSDAQPTIRVPEFVVGGASEK